MTEHDRQPGHALPSSDADLDGALAGTVGDHGRKALLQEVDSIDARMGRLQLRVNGEIQSNQVWLEKREIPNGLAW